MAGTVKFLDVADVERMVPWRFSELSAPTAAAVQDMIARHSAALVSLLRSKGLEPPEPGSNGYLTCQQIVLYQVLADILRYRYMEGDQAAGALAQYYDQLALTLISRLEQNPTGTLA